MVVTILVWRWLYAFDGGINIMLQTVGLETLTRSWLGDRGTVLYSIMFVGFPFVAGLNFLIYLAGLQGIAPELLDAAVVDGASAFQRFFHVELPLIRGQIRLLVMLTIVFWLRSFELPMIMTDGGPGWASMVPGLRMYQTVTSDFTWAMVRPSASCYLRWCSWPPWFRCESPESRAIRCSSVLRRRLCVGVYAGTTIISLMLFWDC